MLGVLAGAASSLMEGAVDQIFAGANARREWEYKQKEMALQQEYNLQNMETQYQYQMDFWNAQNRYNDPTNAAARWRNAGVSPMAVFGSSPGGSGVAGSSVSAPTSTNPSASGSYGHGAGLRGATLSEMYQMDNQRKITKAQVDVLRSEARLNDAKAFDQEWKNTLQPQYERQLHEIISGLENDNTRKAIENAWTPFQYAMQAALQAKDLKAKDKAIEKFMAEIDELKSRKLLNEAEAYRAKEGALNLAALTKTEDESRPYKVDSIIRDNALKTSQTALNWYQHDVLGPQQRQRIAVDTLEAKKRAVKVDAEIERLAKENKYTDAQIEYLKHLRRIGWAKFGVSTLKSFSEEARGWFLHGSKSGAASGWNIDEDALGAIAATL